MVELPAAVVGDVDPLDPVIERDAGILGGTDALEAERDVELILQALDRAPIERRLMLAAGHPLASARDMPFGDVALAPAVVRSVDGQKERRIAVPDRALDMVVDPGIVAADVELIDAQRLGRGLGHFFQTGQGDRGEHVRDAEFARGAHDGRAGALLEAFQRADRRQHDRQPQPAAELLDRGIHLAHIAQNARPERNRVERHAVALERGLALGAADDVVPVVLVEVLARPRDDLMQVLELQSGGCAAGVERRLVGGLVGAFVEHGGIRLGLSKNRSACMMIRRAMPGQRRGNARVAC